MTAFDEFTTKFRRMHGQDLDRTETRTIKVSHNGTYIARSAWNAALDQIEGLADEWDDGGVRVGPSRVSQTATAAAGSLRRRIKELRGEA